MNRADFPVLQQIAYLQTGSVGLMPVPVQRRLTEWTARYYADGPPAPETQRRLAGEMQAARRRVAALIGAQPNEITWVQNVTSGLDVIALGLEWQPDDEVIVATSEHVAGLMPWRRLERLHGVRLVFVTAGADTGWQVLPERVAAAITGRTRLICLSHVSYSTGARLEAAAIAQIARQRGVLLALDGAQAAGAIPVDVHAIGCHFYAFPGYKWTLAPEGTAALYVAPGVAEQIEPHRIGYWNTARLDPDGRYELRRDARRFEGTTYPTLAFAGWGMALEYLEQIGADAVQRRITDLMDQCRQALGGIPGVEVITPDGAASETAGRSAGLLTFRVAGVDPQPAAEWLYRKHRVLIRSVHHPEALRASLHFYNSTEDIERLAHAVRLLAKGEKNDRAQQRDPQQ